MKVSIKCDGNEKHDTKTTKLKRNVMKREKPLNIS